MINLENEIVTKTFMHGLDKAKGLKKRTKKMVCVGMVAMMLGSLVAYDMSTGIAYAAGGAGSTPYVVKAGDKELAVVQSGADAELVIQDIKQAYGKMDDATVAIVYPALTIEKKEYVTAEQVDVKTVEKATADILEMNNTENPIFEVTVTKPLVGNQEINYETTYVEDDDLDLGTTKVVTAGVKGSKRITGQETLVNGKVEDSTVYTEEVVSNPVNEVIAKGTKEEVVEEEETATDEATAEETTASSTARRATSTARRTSSTSYPSSSGSTYNGGVSTSKGNAIAAAALAQVGVQQDCTMLVTNSLRAVGINHHGWPASYLSLGTVTSNPVPGDIIVYQGHVAIYIGNGRAVHGGWHGVTTVVASVSCGQPFIAYVHIN